MRIHLPIYLFMGNVVQISEAVSIAMHCMATIAKSDEQLNSVQLAEKLGFSKNHVSKIMQLLVKHNFLISNRGPKGGFKLAKEPENISLLDIYQLVEGIVRDELPCHAINNCPFKQCLFGGITQQLTNDFISYFKGKTLADI